MIINYHTLYTLYTLYTLLMVNYLENKSLTDSIVLNLLNRLKFQLNSI